MNEYEKSLRKAARKLEGANLTVAMAVMRHRLDGLAGVVGISGPTNLFLPFSSRPVAIVSLESPDQWASQVSHPLCMEVRLGDVHNGKISGDDFHNGFHGHSYCVNSKGFWQQSHSLEIERAELPELSRLTFLSKSDWVNTRGSILIWMGFGRCLSGIYVKETRFNGQQSIGNYKSEVVPYSYRFLVLHYKRTAVALASPEIAGDGRIHLQEGQSLGGGGRLRSHSVARQSSDASL